MSHIEKPAKAGGFSSLQSTMKQVLRSQKTRQNIKNLLRVNQTDGFDCPVVPGVTTTTAPSSFVKTAPRRWPGNLPARR